MSSRRVLKAAEAIREVVSMAILTELRDPRVRDVTVTFVQVSPDMRRAKVNVSIMGDDAKQRLSLRGLQSAAGFLQQKVADRIDTRYTPRLTFILDKGVKHSIEVSRILEELSPAGASDPISPPPDSAEFDAAAAESDPPVPSRSDDSTDESSDDD